MKKNLIIKNGTVVNGNGSKPVNSDIKIEGEKISVIKNNIPSKPDDIIIDATKKIVSPGFFDIHNHSDFYLLQENHSSFLKPFCYQGITTLVCGNCGFSAFPLKKEMVGQFKKLNEVIILDDKEFNINWETCEQFLNILEKQRILFNFIPITGHGVLRTIFANGAIKLSGNQMEIIKKNIIRTLDEGSFGLSTGLGYSPGCFSDTEEIIEFVKILSSYPNTIYTSHARGYSETLIESVEEFLKVAETTGVKSELSHFISFACKYTSKIKKALNKIEQTNKKGFIAQYDDLTYYTGLTTIMALIPQWEYEDGVNNFLKRIKDNNYLNKIMNEILNYEPKWPLWENNYWSDNLIRNSGWQNTYVVGLENNKDLIGLTFLEISEKKNMSISKVLRDLLIEENGNILVHVVDGIGGDIGDEDIWIDYLIEHPLCNIMLDSLFQKDFKSRPDAFGGFTKFIRKYVKEKKSIKLEDAIYKLTKKVADLFSIKNRGFLHEGNYADIVVFDFDKITDNPIGRVPLSYIGEPQLSSGIEYLFINGEMVIDNGNYLDIKKPGRVIRRENS